jgi:hypothetical protein
MLPQFFVAGAMKAGTTYLCSILDAHPDVFISKPREPFFFDRDDYVTQAHFLAECRGEWRRFDWSCSRDALLTDYERLFESADNHTLCGEGSTSYMASPKAARRISEVVPHARIIFLLRDPVQRAYSAYWHWVRTGRAVYSFEGQIQHDPLIMLQRGLYKDHLRQYLDWFPQNQLCVLIFEAFIERTQQTVDRVCDFLGISTINVDAVRTRKNRAQVPRHHRLHMVLNVLGRLGKVSMVNSYLLGDRSRYPDNLFVRLVRHIQSWNLSEGRYPPMDPDTRQFLEEFYRRENAGLPAMLNVDLGHHWEWWDSDSGTASQIGNR